MRAALSSCSKDSDGDSPNNKTGDARLTISLQASGAGTKADNEELSGEANINNVSVLQFNESGSTLQIEPLLYEVSGNGSITLPDIPASSGMAKIVIVTNTVGNPFANRDILQPDAGIACTAGRPEKRQPDHEQRGDLDGKAAGGRR